MCWQTHVETCNEAQARIASSQAQTTIPMLPASQQGVEHTKSETSTEKASATSPGDAGETTVTSASHVSVEQTSIPISNPSLAPLPSGQERVESTSNLDATNPPREIHQDNENGKPENSSFNSTLSGNHRHSDPPTRADASTTIRSLPTSNGNGNPKLSNGSKASKPSFFSRLVHILIPCISPSSVYLEDIQTVSPQVPTSTDDTPKKFEEVKTPILISDLPATSVEEKSAGKSSGLQDVLNPPVLVDESRRKETGQREPSSSTDLESVMSGGVQAPGSGAIQERAPGHEPHQSANEEESEASSFTEEEDIEDLNHVDEVDDDEDRLILNGGTGIPIGPDGLPRPLLPPVAPHHAGRKCLILDLDETLVHSSFKSIQQADYVVPVEIEYHWHNVYVIKRPGVDNFLKRMGEIYEVVVFTASLSKYADPVLDKLDIHRVVSHRLFRESCYNHKGNYVKDLSQLGRPISDTIILDNSPASYIFHPNNAVPVSSWFNDPHDTELTDLVPFLADLATAEDVRGVLDGAR